MLHLVRLVNLPVAVKTCLRKYLHVRGRAPRSEFWWFVLLYALLLLLYLCLRKGASGPNRYGADPLAVQSAGLPEIGP